MHGLVRADWVSGCGPVSWFSPVNISEFNILYLHPGIMISNSLVFSEMKRDGMCKRNSWYPSTSLNVSRI